ncbi:DUF1853 family protein [Winogradskyella immobilis]|uniref:DUF1853 family protein n=1 Tax=Winogradskyella immobilis TaxID=2816852 RepID=A0ABS8EPC8_9FLAO|nr:DUF1853 family protein [Winogradskyella immobilis]MCC1485079.1 DUF1853 family protein [Winogradskyella immobilis]MCG0017171.1 DUF1853 family protein [Winogradskyella immobilis]
MNNQIELQYHGFINTPSLWANNDIYGLNQFKFENYYRKINNLKQFNANRLGKRVEQFVVFHLNLLEDINIIDKNIQIKKDKRTIGELDLLLLNKNQATHIEIIYKFYLYDTSIDSRNQLDKWIGPNKKDTLIYKLKKLKEKQLPLINHPNSKRLLENYFVSAKNIEQHVCFKAQLFIPYKTNQIDISPLNTSCIKGFYIPYSQLDRLKNCMFYIPKKLDWLIEPHLKVDWMSFDASKIEMNMYIGQLRSPLCWLRSKNNTLQKCFVTFWEN